MSYSSVVSLPLVVGWGEMMGDERGTAEPEASLSPNQARQDMWIQVMILVNPSMNWGKPPCNAGPQFLPLQSRSVELVASCR